MIKYLKLPFSFDVSRLQKETTGLLQNHWQLHYQTKHYDGQWTGLPLRSPGGNSDSIIIAPTDDVVYENTAFLNNSPYLLEVLETFQCPLLAVRLLNLSPGSIIKEHRDADLYFEKGEIRLHIPVITNEHVDFFLDKEKMFLQEGECWYMNFNLPHQLANNGKTDRVHLVIDAVVNDWVKNLFARDSLHKKEIEEPGLDDDTKKKIVANLRAMNTEVGNRMADEIEGIGKSAIGKLGN